MMLHFQSFDFVLVSLVIGKTNDAQHPWNAIGQA
jgi:hypothetical protein